MIVPVQNYILAMGSQPAPGTVADPRAQMLQMFGPLIFMAVIMYLLLIRPQQKKAKAHAELLKSVKTGDKVVTSGGILGVVVGVKEKSVSIRSADTKFEILKSSIGEILEKSNSSTAES